MLSKVVSSVQRELNSFLTTRYLKKDIVIPTNVIDQAGNLASEEPNKIFLSLINIVQEPFAPNSSHPSFHRTSNEDFVQRPPVVGVNMYLLFAAYFDTTLYLEGLGVLSSIIAFFQRKPVFDHNNTPLLDADIDKLQFQIVSLDLAELSQLWGTLGAKFMPSVIYKVRMVTYRMDGMIDEIPSIKGLSTDSKPE